MKRLSTVMLLALAGLALGQTAPAGKFTISKETTLVEGPLRADGTVDYVRVFNERFDPKVAAEKNAAMPLYEACTSAADGEETVAALATLHMKVPERALLQRLGDYAKGVKTEDVARWEAGTLDRPWRAADFPEVARWLKVGDEGLARVEEACRRSVYFSPIFDNTGPRGWLGIPPWSPFRIASKALLAHAVLRAGEGDFDGALMDLGRLRILGRLCIQEPMAISDLVGMSCELMAFKGCQQLLTTGKLSRVEIEAVQKLMEKNPPLVTGRPEVFQAEHLLCLEAMMTCIRGDEAKMIAAVSGVFDGPVAVDTGDFGKVDWDVLLRQVNRDLAAAEANAGQPEKPLLERLAAFAEEEKALIVDKRPGPIVIKSADRPPSVAATAAYFKMRAGEDRAAFSIRIAHLIGTEDPTSKAGYAKFDALYTVRIDLARVACALEVYRVNKGEYPTTLAALAGPMVIDPFTGKGLGFRRDGSGYVLWSAGSDLKDDGGEAGDLVVKVARP